MDMGESSKIAHPLPTSCNCYRLSSLTKIILDHAEISSFKDRYVLGEQLGWGQFGVIRACSDMFTGEVLACKSIAKDRLVTPNDVCTVKLEIEIMSRLSGHPNVVNLKAVYEEDDYMHLLMELCAGGELFHQLEKHGRFSEQDAWVIFKHLIQVVQYCHDNGIVHRDLKPENILLASRSSSSPIKLADFGLATYVKPGENLQGTVGSPFYIAPEVLAGGYNQAADVWSAGVILYILLSGMPPFWGKTKSTIFDAVRAADLRFPPDPWDHISVSAKDLIKGMLCVNPSKRLNAAEVLAHSWMQDFAAAAQESYKLSNFDSKELEMTRSSFSSPFITRDQDYSFSCGSPVTAEGQQRKSSLFTSFSSFLVDNCTPCSPHSGFSFSNPHESGSTEFSSPIPSMLSFSFFSPSSADDKEDIMFGSKAMLSKMDAVHGEPALGKLFQLPDNSLPMKLRVGETIRSTNFQQGNIGSKVSSIPSRRNHTIGLGELDQLNVVFVESVIRWASCTHIRTAPSLRLSLVC